MEGEEIIRAYQLQRGDIFRVGKTRYKVRRIIADRIYYYYYHHKNMAGKLESMGANSQEKLILITNKTKQNEHQN